jgi:hypothetical protein
MTVELVRTELWDGANAPHEQHLCLNKISAVSARSYIFVVPAALVFGCIIMQMSLCQVPHWSSSSMATPQDSAAMCQLGFESSV